MFVWLALGAIVTAVAEIWVIVRLSENIGPADTLLALILCSAGGAWIVKREGLSAARRLRDSMRTSRIPTREVVDGAMVLVAGAFLLPPGFLTSIVGLLLIIPPVRRLVGGEVADHLRVRVARRLRVVDLTGGAAGARAGAGAGPGADRRTHRQPGPARPPAPEVIDVEGEEIDLFGGAVELGPSPRD